MAQKNFNLETKKITTTAKVPVARKVYTEEQKAEMLSDYLDLPLDMISSIRYGNYIRYQTKTNGFNPGGLIMKNPVVESSGKKAIKLHAGIPKTANYRVWTVPYEEFVKIYIKPNAVDMLVLRNFENTISVNTRNLEKITEYIRSLSDRVDRLEKRLKN